MNRKLKTFIASAILVLLTGCAHTGTSNQPDQKAVEAAILLKNVAGNAAALAIADNPDNRKHVELAASILDTFLAGPDYSPTMLAEKMKPVFKELRDPKVSIAVNAVLTLYEIYWGRQVKGNIAGNQTAALFITSLRDGAKQGLLPGSE